MIINQVEELKRLVNEFSTFARMPAPLPRPHNIARIIEEAMSLFKEAQRDVKMVFNVAEDVVLHVQVTRRRAGFYMHPRLLDARCG